MTGFRWFQMVSVSLWVVSAGFWWFQLVAPRFSKYDSNPSSDVLEVYRFRLTKA